MYNTLKYAMKVYYDNKREWNKMVERAMEADFSWGSSARKYEELYLKLSPEVKEAAEEPKAE